MWTGPEHGYLQVHLLKLGQALFSVGFVSCVIPSRIKFERFNLGKDGFPRLFYGKCLSRKRSRQ